MKTAVPIAALILLPAVPAQAQFTNGGGAVPFQQGLSTLLNWAFIAGVAIALFCFILGCVLLYMRNLIGFVSCLLGVAIGGALMANAQTLVSSLTGLQGTF